MVHFHISTNTTNSFPYLSIWKGITGYCSNKRKWRWVIPEGFVPPTNFHAGSLKEPSSARFLLRITSHVSSCLEPRVQTRFPKARISFRVATLWTGSPLLIPANRSLKKHVTWTSHDEGWRYDRSIETFPRYFGNYRRILILVKKRKKEFLIKRNMLCTFIFQIILQNVRILNHACDMRQKKK